MEGELSFLSLHDHSKNSYPFSLSDPGSRSERFLRWAWQLVLCLGFTQIVMDYVQAAPSSETSKLIGSMVLDARTGGQWLRDEGNEISRETQSLGIIWGVRPGVDYAINHFIWVGGELGVSWLNEPARRVITSTSQVSSYAGGQRVVFTPAVRGRLDFPIDCRWVFEGNFNTGLTMWGVTRDAAPEAYDESRWGISWRVQFGVRYIINTQVHAVVGGGYAEQQVYTDQGSISVSTFPLTLGLRGGF